MMNRRVYFLAGLFVLFLSAASFASTVTPANSTAGATTTYTVDFTLTALDNLPADGSITITFGSLEYDLTGTLTATSPDISGGFLAATPGGGQSVTFVRDSTGAALLGGNTYTIVFGNVTNPTTAQSYTLTVTTSGGSTDPSSSYSITADQLDHFTVSDPTPFTPTAGVNFSVTVAAFDQFNNATAFNGTVNLSDNTTTLTPTSVAMAGVSVDVTNARITKAQSGVQITASESGGASGISSAFTVDPAPLDHFTVSDPTPATPTAGEDFTFTVAAFDEFNNARTFSGTVSLTDNTTTLTPTSVAMAGTSVSITNGQITQAQSGIQITASEAGGATGTSNSFTVVAADIATFDLSDPGTQEAGVTFNVTVSNARDSFGNLASGTIAIDFNDSDSHQVPNGESPVLADIAVANGSGTEAQLLYLRESGVVLLGTVAATSATDSTQPFSVNAGLIQNFSFRDPGAQTAGVGFILTVENARDGFNNPADGTVEVSFFDAGTHIAPDGTAPTLRNILVGNGSGSNTQDLFRAETGLLLSGSVTATGASDDTQAFDVTAATLAGFTLDTPGTQTAGTEFTLSVSNAVDAYENPASGTVQVSFKDQQPHLAPNQIPPTLRDIAVSAGAGSAMQTLVLEENNVQLRGDAGNSVIDDTGNFNVTAGNLAAIQIQVGTAAGDTTAVGNQNLTTGSTLAMHASGFDIYENHRGSESVTWVLVGTNIGSLNPASGPSTTLTATTPGTAIIQATETNSGLIDFTGAIEVSLGNVVKIRIRTAPNNGGKEFGDSTLTADETMTFYAAGYDNEDNYINDFSVDWRSLGGLENISGNSGRSFTFSPTLIGSGQIVADHTTATDDTTGTITVTPGLPAGTVNLTPSATTLAPTDTSRIISSPITDSEGNLVGPGREFDVQLVNGPFGTIITTDANPGKAGHQINTDDNSQLAFVFQAGNEGGTQNIVVSSVGGATGNTSITIGSLRILRVENAPDFVSRGQSGVTNLQMTVENLSPSSATNLAPQLTFSGAGLSFQRKDSFTDIPPAPGTRTFTFDVDVLPNADLGLVTIDGLINAEINNTPVSAQGAVTPDSVTVQDTARVSVVSVTTTPDTVVQGRPPVDVTVRVSNPAPAGVSAAAVLDNIQLKFTLIKDGSDKTNEFVVVEKGGIPSTIAAGATADVGFTVSVRASADSGQYILDANAFGHDINSSALTIRDTDGASTTDTWYVKGAASLEILSLTPIPQPAVRAEQPTEWRVRMQIENSSPDDIDIDFNSVNTYVRFRIGANDVTGEYTIINPDSLKNAGTNRLASGATDTLDFRIVQTGFTTGTATILGSVEGIVVGSGSRISDDTSDDIGLGSVQINPADASVFVLTTSPHTSVPNASPEVGVVNTNQGFKITVVVINDLPEPVDTVVVKLSSSVNSGGSTILTPQDTIASIPANSSGSIDFDIIAAGTANPTQGETFTAEVLNATGQHSRQPAPIGSPTDNNVLFRIQDPADLVVSLSMDTVQTANDTFEVSATVTNLGQADIDNAGRLVLTVPASYLLVPGSVNPAAFSLDNPVTWEVIAPASETVSDTFIVNISQVPNDVNIAGFAQVTRGVDSVQIRTSDIGLAIDEFRIVSPAGALDDTLSSEQEFAVQANITRTASIDSVRATLQPPPGISLAPGFTKLTKSLGPGVTSASWNLKVAANQTGQSTLTVQMVAFDRGEIAAQTSANIVIETVLKGRLQFVSFRSNLQGNRASVNQQFQLTAEIRNFGGAGVTPGRIRLNQGNSGIINLDADERTFDPDENVEVVWNVRAPATPTARATITARIEEIPKDENSGQEAAPATLELPLEVETGEFGAATINKISVLSPPGAQDGVISTNQQLTVEAEVGWNDLVQLQAQISWGDAGYTVLNGTRTKNITQGPVTTVQWELRASPNAVTQHHIKVEVFGNDASSGQPVNAVPDSIQSTVVERADLTLVASISSPPSAIDRILTVGQQFTITAELQNTGAAGLIGEDNLRIELPPSYTISEPSIKSVAPDNQVSWSVTAPDNPTNQVEDIVISVDQQNSIDENTGDNPPFGPSSVKIPVQTQAVGLNLTQLNDRKPTTIPRGATDQPIFGLRFANSSDDDINLERINLTVEDNDGNEIAPNAVLSGLRVVDYDNSSEVFATLASMPASNAMQIDFNPNVTIAAGQNRSIEFRVDLLAQSDTPNFSLTIRDPNRNVLARNTASDSLVAILDEAGFEIQGALSAGSSAIIGSGFAASFFNFPNPFGQGEQTMFNYSLPQDSQVTLRIYTLLGELVWTTSFSASDAEGKAGNHDGVSLKAITWDGKNGKSQEVLNGVYIAVLSTDSDKAVTKVAIAK